MSRVATSFATPMDLLLPGTPAEACYRNGAAGLAKHDLNRAEAAFKKCLRLDPNQLGSIVGMAEVALKRGNTKKAAQHLQKALAVAPKSVKVQTVWGRYLFLQKRFREAKASFKKAIALDSKAVAPRILLADLFLVRGENDNALAEYVAVLKIAPKFADAYIKIGMVHQLDQRVSEAEQAYLAAIELDPNLSIAYNNLAWLAAKRKAKLDEAVIWAKKGVELEPEKPEFLDTLGWVYRTRGELDKAVSVLKKAAALKPQRAEIFYHLGVVYAETGKSKEAIAALNKALSLEKDFSSADDARRRLDALARTP